MKKFSFILQMLLLPAILLPLFCGCGEENSKPQLVMVTDATFPPYEFRENGRTVGIDPDIVTEIASRIGYHLIIEDMNFNSIIAAVQSGKADVAASGITVTEERKRIINFTIPYVSAAQVILVPLDSELTGPEDLKAKDCRIAVQTGTTGDQYVTKNIKNPDRYENAALPISALLAGKADAAILDNAPAKEFAAKNPSIKILPQPLTREYYAFAISKNKPELLKKFNTALKAMKKDGTLQKIIDSYSNKKIDTAAAAAESNGFSISSLLKNLKNEIYINFITDKRYLYLVNGFLITILIAISSVILGIIIGFAVAVIRTTADQTGSMRFANSLCKLYLTVIRGTPVVVQLLIIYFVIFGYFDISKITVAIIAFGLNSGAYVAEIIRSGIMSIDRGQLEASRSLGLSYTHSMMFVIMPQAFKNVLPALGNEFIVLLKETSVSGYIALQDLTKGGDIIRSQTYNAFLPLIVVALIYLAVVTLFTKLLAILEGRLKKNE